jgi:phospholipid/cholesterol/gamma-HCH transport system substrate-binding protein
MRTHIRVVDPQSRAARLGLVGTVVLVAVALVALNSGSLGSLFGGRAFTASFTEAGGIATGDNVIVSGVAVGKVNAVELVGDHVDVGFRVEDSSVVINDQSSAAIKAQTALGKKALQITSAGSSPLESGATIPVTRTTPAYDISEALSELTRTVTGVNTDQLAASFGTLSGVLNSAAPQLRPALSGLQRLSQLLNDRDAELGQLLAHTAGVSGVLADRDQQIQTLFIDGTALLAELNRRGDDISELLDHATALAQQVSGLVDDNRAQLGPALEQLNKVLRTLRENKANIDKALTAAAPLLRELGEVVAGFPGFNVYVPNLVATNLVPTLPGLLTGGAK